MNCKKNLFCFGSADGLNRCTVSWVGLGLLLWTAWGSEVTPLSKVLEAWQTLGSLSRERPEKKKKEWVLCEIYGLQKITAPASVFCYWKHVKAIATKGKSNSLVSKANHCRNPQGSLGYIRHEQYHQPTVETLPWGPASDRHFSASWALTTSLRENREVQVQAGAVLHTGDRGKKDPKYFRLTHESIKISLHLIYFSQGWFSQLDVWWCSTEVALMAQLTLLCRTSLGFKFSRGHRAWTCGPGGGREGGTNWEIRFDINTLPRVK